MRGTEITIGEELKPIDGKKIRGEISFVYLANYLTARDLEEVAALVYGKLATQIKNIRTVTMQITCAVSCQWFEDLPPKP